MSRVNDQPLLRLFLFLNSFPEFFDIFSGLAVKSFACDALQRMLPVTGSSTKKCTLRLPELVLRGILVKAQRWHLLDPDELRPLKIDQSIGRALTFDEKLRLIKLAQSRQEWQMARLAMNLALNTTMRSCEIRGLRWRDVDLME